MARGRRLKNKIFKKAKEYEEKMKQDQTKAESGIQKLEDRASSRANSYFKSEEIQEICGLLNIEELGDQQCFLGAVVIGKFDVVKKLLKEGYSINSVDENKESGLVHAVKHCRLEMVEFLLSRGANPTLVDREGNTALLLAAQATLWDQDSFLGLWRSVRDTPHLGLTLDHANKAGYSLVHYVTKRQWQAALELLLEARVQLDCCTNKGVTPLIMAASRGDAAFTAALLQAGADFTVEDQQKCTALCYSIAFSLQKSVSEPNRAVDLLLTAINEDNSKMSLEFYLQKRLELLVSPPRSAAQFSKTVSTVIVPVVSFFARILYSGIDLLLQLNVFHRLREGLERNLEDQSLTLALLGVCLELVRHCDCCFQELSQADLADAFFVANLGKSCLDILQRYGLSKAGVMKQAFLVLAYVCSSESVAARAWLVASHAQLQPHFTKYMRSSPTLYTATSTSTSDTDPHLQHDRRCSLIFQKEMKALKNQSRLHTKHRDQNGATIPHSVYTVIKPDPVNICFKSLPENKSELSCISKLKRPAVYNAMVQYNFGKLDIIDVTKYSHKVEQKAADLKTASHPTLENTEKDCKRKRKSRMAIKEIQEKLILSSHTEENDKPKNQSHDIESKQLSSSLINAECGTLPDISDNNKRSSTNHESKDRYSEGYQLFNMGDESFSEIESDEESEICRQTCDWLDSYSLIDGTNKNVSEKEVEDTISYLEEIFDRIVTRYDSTWKKQYEEGYIGAQGDADDLLKLMTVLPALEEYHMKKLKTKWKNFCGKVKDHASKSHIIYAAMVSEMQLFLLEFEAELDQRNIIIFNDTENSSSESYIDTEKVFGNLKCSDIDKLSSGKSVEYLINTNIETNKTGANREVEVNCTDSKNNVGLHNSSLKLESKEPASLELLENVYLSDSEEDENEINIWDAKLKEYVKLDLTPVFPEECDQPWNNITLLNEDNESIKSLDQIDKDVSINESLETEIDESKQRNTENGRLNNNSRKTYGAEDKSFCSPPKSVLDNMSQNINNHKESKSESLQNCQSKPPPGFENVRLLNTSAELLRSAFTFCGQKYESLTMALATLPACKAELLDDGRLRLASIEFQSDFKLFNGYNFGDVELGLSSTGMPLAVRRFQKHTTLCNESVSAGLVAAVRSVLRLRHARLLPYVACVDQPKAVVVAAPICHQDLGQHIRQIRAAVAASPLTVTTVAPYLITMVYQLISGLHYLHTLDNPVIHGNLKPSNVMVDTSGALRLAEFGLAQVLFQQRGPALTSMIWWSRDCLVPYYNTWKWVCTQQSDMQSAGMLVHFILTIGEHPYGQSLANIIENIKNGVILMRSSDVIATDLIYWMLSHDPNKRPTTYDALRHVLFWTTGRRWEFLLTCCGLGSKMDAFPLPLKNLYADLDILGQLRDVNTKWISILKQNCERKIGTCMFEDNPSGLLNFLKKNLTNWIEVKDIFLELFPVLPLNLFRLIEQTTWIDHPVFEPFTRVDPIS